MKRSSVFVTTILLITLAQSSLAQSNGSTISGAVSTQSKADKKAEKAKAKASKAAYKAQRGKKSTSTQDAAYALAYMFGIPKA